jgi:hypothetical protein
MAATSQQLRFALFCVASISIGLVLFFRFSDEKEPKADRRLNEIVQTYDAETSEARTALDPLREFRFRSSFNVDQDGILNVELHRPHEDSDLMTSDFQLFIDSTSVSVAPLDDTQVLPELQWKDTLISDLKFEVVDIHNFGPSNLTVLYRGNSYEILRMP